MLWLCQSLSRLAIAAVAVEILMGILVVQLPSLVASQYLKLFTSSNRTQFCFVNGHDILLSVLVSTPCRFKLSSVGKVLVVGKVSVMPGIWSMLSAERRLQIGLPPMEMGVMVVEGFTHNVLRELNSTLDGRLLSCERKLSFGYWAIIQHSDDLGETLLDVEFSYHMPYFLLIDSVKSLFKVYEVVIEVLQMLKIRGCEDATVEDLLNCAPAWSEAILYFSQHFISHGAGEILCYFQYAWMAD